MKFKNHSIKQKSAFKFLTIWAWFAFKIIGLRGEQETSGSIFNELIYDELNLTEARTYLIDQPIRIYETYYKCLSKCNLELLCSYAYFVENTCYICNHLAAKFMIKRTKSKVVKTLLQKKRPSPLILENIEGEDLSTLDTSKSEQDLTLSTVYEPLTSTSYATSTSIFLTSTENRVSTFQTSVTSKFEPLSQTTSISFSSVQLATSTIRTSFTSEVAFESNENSDSSVLSTISSTSQTYLTDNDTATTEISLDETETDNNSIDISLSNIENNLEMTTSASHTFQPTTSRFNFIDSVNISCSINSNFTLTNGLQNYWPFNMGSLDDIIGGANLFGGVNYSFAFDRFNETNASLSLSNGYLQMPPGIYFNSDYTIMAWVYVRSFCLWSRLIDVGNGPTNDSVIYALTNGTSGCPVSHFLKKSTTQYRLISSAKLKLNTWQHITAVFKSPYAFIYIDGSMTANQTLSSIEYPSNLTRAQNYVGRSSWRPNDQDADACIDELKIFSRALNQEEIKYEEDNQICAFNRNKLIDCSVNPGFKKTLGLQNYWPFCNSLIDVIGDSHLTGGVNFLYTRDRFNQNNYSVSLVNGYLIVPPGVYFHTHFTVMAWVNVRSFNWYSRLLDVGNGPNMDDVVFCLTYQDTGYPTCSILNNSTYIIPFVHISTKGLLLNKWQHLAFVYQMPTIFIYIDCVNVAKFTSLLYGFPLNVIRNKNFIGRSNWYGSTSNDKDTDSNIDELKIFSRDLSQSEIQIEMGNEIYSRHDESNCIINHNYKQTNGLSFYWPFCLSLTDVVNGVTLYGGVNNSFSMDRFDQTYSSISLENGYLNLPSGVYISGDHTVMAWVMIRHFNYNSRLLDITNAELVESFAFALTAAVTGVPFVSSIDNSTLSFFLFSSQQLKLNRWTHLAFAYRNFTSYIYIDGVEVCNLTSSNNFNPNNVTRSINYLGRSFSYGLPGKLDQLTDANIDELKIFSRALNQTEILNEMTNEIYSKNISQKSLDGKQVANCNFNSNFHRSPNLQNYWPFCSNLSDVIGGADLFGGMNYRLTNDRFDNPLQSLALTSGYLQLPTGFYFGSSDFTVMLWVFQIQQLSNLTILEFTNGLTKGKISFSLIRNGSGPQIEVCDYMGYVKSQLQVSKKLDNGWQHLAFTFSLSNHLAYIYVNGQNVLKSTISYVTFNIGIQNNFLGKSNLDKDSFPLPFVNFDEIKIFKSALSDIQILSEMKNQIFN